MPTVNFFADFAANKFDADVVVCAFGNNQIGVAFRRLDKLEVHRAHGGVILRDDGFDRATAFDNIALKPSNKSNIVGSINENFDIQ